MTLGEVLAKLEDPSQLQEILLESGNIPLAAKLARAGHQSGDDPCLLALRAVNAFTAHADDEAWVRLIGRVQGSESPAGTCLSDMIAWSFDH